MSNTHPTNLHVGISLLVQRASLHLEHLADNGGWVAEGAELRQLLRGDLPLASPSTPLSEGCVGGSVGSSGWLFKCDFKGLLQSPSGRVGGMWSRFSGSENKAGLSCHMLNKLGGTSNQSDHKQAQFPLKDYRRSKEKKPETCDGTGSFNFSS